MDSPFKDISRLSDDELKARAEDLRLTINNNTRIIADAELRRQEIGRFRAVTVYTRREFKAVKDELIRRSARYRSIITDPVAARPLN